MAIAHHSAQPWRCDPVIRPRVYVRPDPSAKINTSSKKFVSGVGFSKGCALLALKNPPPLVPSSLITSCEAVGPCAMVCSRTICVVTLPSLPVICTVCGSTSSTVELVDPQTVQITGSDGKVTTQIVREQTIAQGPTASQEVIKELGTNGGGFFNANSAHPFENPTPLTNFFELVLIFALGSGLTYTLGRMTGSQRHGWALWCAMAILFLVGVMAAYSAEARGNPLLTASGNHLQTTAGNMEGKE